MTAHPTSPTSPKQPAGQSLVGASCSLFALHLPFPLCREEGEIVIEGHPDDETKWVTHEQFLEILTEIDRAAQCVGGPEIIRDGIARYVKANTNVDLPDTAAQDFASKTNSPAVSG